MKNVARLWLYNQECYLVENEIKLNRLGMDRFCDLDKHMIIDVIGVCMKYFLAKNIQSNLERCNNFNLENLKSYEFGQNITKGIEVKMSRSDFKNGFICGGCNYHYIFTPMRLLALHEVPEGIGLIEFNKYKFDCELNPKIEEYPEEKPFLLKGLRVIKRASFQYIPQFQIDHIIMEIINKYKLNYQLRALKEVEGSSDSMTYQKPY